MRTTITFREAAGLGMRLTEGCCLLQWWGSHLENVCLQDVMAELHGLLAVQLALLSREHECQESMPVPRTRNTQVGNQRPESISLQALRANITPSTPELVSWCFSITT